MYFTEPVNQCLQLLVSELEESGVQVSAEEFERLGAVLTQLDQQVDAYEKEQLVRQLGWLRMPEINTAEKHGAV